MTDAGRRAWLRRREPLRGIIGADDLLAALVSTETRYNTTIVGRVLSGGEWRPEVDAMLRAHCDELRPLVDAWMAGDV